MGADADPDGTDTVATICGDGSVCGHPTGAATWTCRPAVAMGGECPSLGVGPFTCAGGGVRPSGASATATCQAGDAPCRPDSESCDPPMGTCGP